MGVGIDFGTTNSAVAFAVDGRVEVASFRLDGRPTNVFRSLLFFENDLDFVAGRPPSLAGPAAIESYVECGADGRLMQSMKSFLASKSFRATQVHGRNFTLEELVALVIRKLRAGAGMTGDCLVAAGRPVRFAYSQSADDDAFAERRLREAFVIAGCPRVEFVHEPVAAALHYESGLDHEEVVLVADFGGGTSDFSLLQVGPEASSTPPEERILGNAGVGVAGDSFDARLIENLVAPALGRGSLYRTEAGDCAALPKWIFTKLVRWHELSVLKSQRNTEMLARYALTAVEPDKVQALISVVEDDLGYALYRAVEQTKFGLTDHDRAELRFEDAGIRLQVQVTREQFEGWIEPELSVLRQTVDGLLNSAGMTPADVDTVFMTGGSARVPAVRDIFASRFGADRLRAGDYHASVAAGLALHAERLEAR